MGPQPAHHARGHGAYDLLERFVIRLLASRSTLLFYRRSLVHQVREFDLVVSTRNVNSQFSPRHRDPRAYTRQPAQAATCSASRRTGLW